MTWRALADADPALAAIARDRLHGRVGYLATAHADGGPRVHPVTPIVADDARLFLFMEPTSPKGRDLLRDGRYALHCGVEDASGGGGEVLVRGRAAAVDDAEARAVAALAAPYEPADRYVLFELGIDEVAVTRYGPDGPERQGWRAPGAPLAE